ncbi:hypothetical protein IWW51_005487, partial [Coemansia sp. RSA 2702]
STSTDFGTTAVLDRFAQIEPKLLFSTDATCYNGRVHPHVDKLAMVASELPSAKKVVVIPFDASAEAADLSPVPNACLWSDFMATADANCELHRKEHQITQDLGPGDVMLYYTTTGWMMWNWLVGALSVGTAIVLYEGSPFKPDASVLWAIVDRLGVTAFGTSAKYIQSLEDMDYRPMDHHSLHTLQAIYSTASPLKPNSFDFVYQHVKRDRYRAAYFDHYPHVWYQGDFMTINGRTGGVYMLGRSDGTLNPAGVRFGSAELYNIVDTYPEVVDSLVVGQQLGADERVLLFLEMADGHEFSADIVGRINAHIRRQLSPRHVPALVLPVKGIPYTRNSKKLEIAVKRLVSDLYRVAQATSPEEALRTVKADEKTTSTMANPESLEQFYHLPELLA